MEQAATDVDRTVDRETLYQEVWAQPMTTVAVRYGVSSSFLARVCERLNRDIGASYECPSGVQDHSDPME
jgi:methylaspartate ammonia-lyase